MRIAMHALLASGLVAGAIFGAPTTTKAQGVSIYGPGVEVDIGRSRSCGPNAHWDGYRCVSHYYRPGYDAYGYYRPYRSWGNCPPYHAMRNGVCIRVGF